jgi:hypothetical protein
MNSIRRFVASMLAGLAAGLLWLARKIAPSRDYRP